MENQLGNAQEALNGSGSSGLSRLLNKDVLVPAAATAITAAAAGLAAKKGPELKSKLVGEAREGAEDLGRSGAEGAKEGLTGGGGTLSALAGGASKLLPGKGAGHKKTRRLPIQRWTDVAVPLDRAWEAWTRFEDFPKFMHRALNVEQKDDRTISWEEKIWFSTRRWEAEITDRDEKYRIAWKTTSGTSHTGVISFHRIEKNLTRVMVTLDFQPAGMLEKMGSGLRFAKRAVQADLARFKAFVELGDAEGVEYESAPAAQEDGDGGEESRGNGRANRNGSQSDEARESERSEREQRRQERRESASSS